MFACAACRHLNPDGATRCAQCGRLLDGDATPPHDGEERRHLTVLFCDLVDSSSLAESLGAEAYREIVGAVHASSATIIEHHGGQVSQYLGDGVLALFGYPRAKEDDAARAIHAALELQAAIITEATRLSRRVTAFSGDLHSRAAIHTGLVVVGAVGAGAARSILAFGDAVNVASRLQEFALPDTLLLTAATRRLIGERFELEPRGQPNIRGIRHRFDMFQVTGARPAATMHDAARRGERTPMVGRERELASIVDRWGEVEGGRGQIVVVGGDAGIGKSRLLAAVRRRLSPGGGWLEFRGSLYHQVSELRSVLEFVERRMPGGSTALDARRQLADELHTLGPDGVDSARLLAPLLALPQRSNDAPLPTVVPDEMRRRVLDVLERWVWRTTERAPVVIVVEDLQWIDPTSAQLFRSLITNSSHHAVLVVATCRDLREVTWPLQPNELRIQLEPLTRAEAQRLVESVAAGRPLPESVVADVLAKGDGVPLFLEEVTHMLLDPSGAVESVPDELQDLLAARLDRLPASARETVRLCAVLGRRFARDLLEAVSQKDPAVLEGDLAFLVGADIVRSESDGFSFKHTLLRDAAYERSLSAARARVHGRAAAILQQRFPHVADTQPELVARHFTEAGETEPAAQEWTRAGFRSLWNAAHVEAVHHFHQALTLVDKLPDSIDRRQRELALLSALGVSLVATTGYASQAVMSNYTRARTLSNQLRRENQSIPIPVLYGVWGSCLARSDRQATSELVPEWHAVERSEDPMARHIAHSALGTYAFYRGEFETALTHFDNAMALYDPSKHGLLLREYGFEGGLYAHLYAACALSFTGQPDRARALVSESLDLARATGDPYVLAVSLALGACVARERGDSERTYVMSDELVALATDHRFVMWLGIAHCLRGWSRLDTGNAGEALKEIRSGLDTWEITGAQLPGTYLRLLLVDAQLTAGELPEAATTIENGLVHCRTTLEAYQTPEYHRLKGEVLARMGDTELALRETQLAVLAARDQRADWMELRAALSVARLAGPAERAAAMNALAAVSSRISEGSETPLVALARTHLATFA